MKKQRRIASLVMSAFIKIELTFIFAAVTCAEFLGLCLLKKRLRSCIHLPFMNNYYSVKCLDIPPPKKKEKNWFSYESPTFQLKGGLIL